MINVSLNNQLKSLKEDSTLSAALSLWSFENLKIAVAINGEFVPRSSYAEKILLDGDKIDIVKPIGGG